MIKYMKRLFLLLVIFGLSFSLFSCNISDLLGGSGDNTGDNTEETGNQKTNNDSNDETEEKNPSYDENGNYIYEGKETVGPFMVYNEDGTEVLEYEFMFDAIRHAGAYANSKNKMYVLDANKLLVFQRQSKTNCWCYDGTNFVGSMAKNDAVKWSANKPKSYVVDGQGIGYVALGALYYEGSDMSQDIPLELYTGAYNYLFSKGGEMAGGEWVTPGYGYMECYVRLSQATYTVTKDDINWNAYIFINGSGGTHSDLGLIGVVRDGKLVWALVRNCSHTSHTQQNPGFMVTSWDPVTTMEYDSEKGYYCGGDDLFFQCWQGVNGWILKITNLTTGKVHTLNENHPNMFANSTQYFRFLLAASYVPALDTDIPGYPLLKTSAIWNPRCGASLRNIVFDGVNIARYNSDEEYDESMFEEFYPGTSNMIYGFTQGADCSSMVMGTYETDGNNSYMTGENYKAGDKFVSFSSYYDGGGHYHGEE